MSREVGKAHILLLTMKTEQQKKKNREYMKEYHERPEVKIKERRYLKEYNKRPEVKEKFKEYMKKYHERPEVKEKFKEYMKKYSKKPAERHKKIIRMQSQRIYGKVPKGYERHHINYDSPHNFILIPIGLHKRIHEKLRGKK